MMKKKICLQIVLGIVLLLLVTGCGNKKEDKKEIITQDNIKNMSFSVNGKSVQLPCTVQDLANAGLTPENIDINKIVEPQTSLVSRFYMEGDNVFIQVDAKNITSESSELKNSVITRISYAASEKDASRNKGLNFSNNFALYTSKEEIEAQYPEASKGGYTHSIKFTDIENYYKSEELDVKMEYSLNTNNEVSDVTYSIIGL